ncbi:MAG TPA: thioredoxin domain-containing protein [Terracidiphilus sp.]|nr:thioredoxin domain-containing protein [Terracidiphilus sp.]
MDKKSNPHRPTLSAPAHRAAAPLIALAAAFLAASLASAPARAQFSEPHTVHVLDASALHPPAGARVAIIEFDDLECPACAHANPVLMQAAASYKIPWVRRDFLIPGHIWSPIAAVNARWFDTKSKTLGDEYRNYIFANQISIETQPELRQFTQKFAAAHGIAMPFAVDPQGKLAAEVQADTNLAERMGLKETPTIFIAIANSKGPQYIQVLQVDQDLYRDIDQALDYARH